MIARENRFDFRGGVNTAFSVDTLTPREVRSAINYRLTKFGSLLKRSGTQRVHSSAIGTGADVLGTFQWDAPAAAGQIVGIAGGNFYHKTLAASNFTEVASTLSTSNLPWFAAHNLSGTATLYIADGALRKWNGTALTTSISGAPSARTVAVYKRRLFATDNTKTLYWSSVDNPDAWATADGGGSAPVETFDLEPVVGLAVVGSSLLLFKENSIARYTGVRASEINIDLDTEGVSADVGCFAPKSICRFDQHVFFLSDRGPYAATEAGVIAIGAKIENKFDRRAWSDAVAVHHKGAREVWLWSPGLGEGWCYNYRLEAWTGPHSLASAYGIYSACTFEDSTGFESILYGGGDGFVRDGDKSGSTSKDDILSDGTGGTNITATVTMPTIFFGDPTAHKIAPLSQWIGADLGASGSMTVTASSEQQASNSVTVATKGAGVNEYDVRLAWKGRRLELSLSEATSNVVEIAALKLQARMGRRVA